MTHLCSPMGDSATRSIAENTAAETNIGTAVAATDQDGDTLTYTLGGTDSASFDIVSTSGQLQTKAALDYETKNAYAVTVTVSDGTLTDTIDITINVTNANEAPTFTEGSSTTRTVAENTASGTNIGSAVAATDVDNDTLTYTLGGTDAASFSIASTHRDNSKPAQHSTMKRRLPTRLLFLSPIVMAARIALPSLSVSRMPMTPLCSPRVIAQSVPSRRTRLPAQTSARRSRQPIRMAIRLPIHSVAR